MKDNNDNYNKDKNKKETKFKLINGENQLTSIQEKNEKNKRDIIYIKTLTSFNNYGKKLNSEKELFPIVNLTFVSNIKHITINHPPEYTIPLEYEKPTIKLKSLDSMIKEDFSIIKEEEKDLVDGLIKLSHDDFFRMRKIKLYFKYGNMDSFHVYNSHISNKLKSFYEKFENLVNFRYDIYSLPLLKNHLYFLNFRDKESKKFNYYKHNIEKINSYLKKNDINMINKINLMKLNTTRELLIIQKDFKNLGEKPDNETADYVYFSYFDKKDDSQCVKLANEEEKKAILRQPNDKFRIKKESSVIMRIFGLRKKTIRRPIYGIDINEILMKHLECHLRRNPFKFEKKDNLIEKCLRINKNTKKKKK